MAYLIADAGDHQMNFREKTAWLNVIAMVAAYSLYFGLLLSGRPAGRAIVAAELVNSAVVLLSYRKGWHG
ncbi:hypothetical protein E5675_17200 [Sphingopyxis sp. PAMC25046]|uniref:hypothetical protein n=1 Tax=Sphingopyxis sp. PAMC25046 TaxID=2565556 RepID=UPI00109D9B33|nr:hypothetical protein [Sphingopyxis sp. PAMC25046]QCB55997.1 hypothetical protein E5675_17200 [Sphingopyxis sp. PAMC25046]